MPEKVVCIRMEPKYEAKSYVPDAVIAGGGMEVVGGRKYAYVNEEGQEEKAKLYFVKTDDSGLQNLRNIVTSGKRDSIQKWREQIVSIRSFDLLVPSEKIMGFDDEWNEGAVEIVLHPSLGDVENMLSVFCTTTGLDRNKLHVKTYENSVVFVSTKCSQVEIDRAKRFNPLRAVHPIGDVRLTRLHTIPGSEAPKIVPPQKKSAILVGVFDGGADANNPLLSGYTNAHDCIGLPVKAEYLEHGTAVCGAVLHGNLAGRSKTDILEAPCVSVESFRVLPLQGTGFSGDYEQDIGLYPAIDAIEKAVIEHPNIKLFNISFGPPEPIIDDSISRFTFALDRLTYLTQDGEINPLFCVAVGNDGEQGELLNRIQAPSDMVNGLSVGAYTYRSDGSKKVADYSCIGSGREGAKVKPDIVEFGGSADRPFILVSPNGNTLSSSAGTSFASPLALGKVGRLMAQSEMLTPHTGRTLLIHQAQLNDDYTQEQQGFGFAIDNVDEILYCGEKRVCILYSASLNAMQTAMLPIFAPRIDEVRGNVEISWTITTLVNPNGNDPDAYTNNCILDVFVPNDMIYNFTKKGKKTVKVNLLHPDAAAQVRELQNQGYRRSDLPVSHPAKKNWNEAELRNNDFKWDTVIKKTATMRGSSLFNPFLTLQAIGRNGYEQQELKYHVAITVSAPKYHGSLYDLVLQTYPQLAPIEIRNVNRVMVEI